MLKNNLSIKDDILASVEFRLPVHLISCRRLYIFRFIVVDGLEIHLKGFLTAKTQYNGLLNCTYPAAADNPAQTVRPQPNLGSDGTPQSHL